MKTWMKVGLAILAVPAVSVLGLAGWVSTSVSGHLNRTYNIQPVTFSPAIHADAKAGEHIVRVRNGCAECHGDNLAGGKVIDDPAMGLIYAPNLTPAVLKDWSDGEIARAIRHGVGKNGHALLVMPSDDFIHFSEQDLANVVAFLRSLPPVEQASTPSRMGPVASALLVTGQAPLLPAEGLNHAAPFPQAVPEGDTAAFGAYLAQTVCMGCHQPNLKGGKIASGPPDWPEAANLTQAGNLGHWSEADFLKAMRSGVTPQGVTIRPPMPIKMTSQFTDLELKALWKYLQTMKG